MEFKFDFKDIDELEFIYKDKNSYEYNGIQVPRVTAVISSMMHSDSLMYWANSLGFKHQKYSEVINEACEYGTNTHKGIELFLKGESIPKETPYHSMNAFLQWWNSISNNNELKILGQEQTLVCPYYGGTYDLLLSINNKPWLIDFKTSNHISYRYYLQLAAYNRILRDDMNINLGGVLLLQLEKTRPVFHEYTLDFSRQPAIEYFNTCEKTFMSMLYSYYHLKYLEKNFNKIHNT